MPMTTRRALMTMGDVQDNDGNYLNSSNSGVVTAKEANA
jgi:hypothetical protein